MFFQDLQNPIGHWRFAVPVSLLRLAFRFVSSQSAIAVTADYSLLQEGNGKDILENAADLWKGSVYNDR